MSARDFRSVTDEVPPAVVKRNPNLDPDDVPFDVPFDVLQQSTGREPGPPVWSGARTATHQPAEDFDDEESEAEQVQPTPAAARDEVE